jgi:hypothetical protein
MRRIAMLLGGILLIAAGLPGCATPQPVRQLAGKSAAAVGLAEASLRDYLSATNAQLSARMELLRYDATKLEEERIRREFNALVSKRARAPSDDDAKDLILALAADARHMREEQDKRFERIEGNLAFDPNALAQAPKEKLASAKKSFAVLSEELTAREWLALVGSYAQTIQQGIEEFNSPKGK